jgi:hypothetical protein
MRSIVIGLVLLFAVFTFVGAIEQPGSTPVQSASVLGR